MVVLVYDVAAELGGALSILWQVYEKAKKDYTNIKWIFVLSVVDLPECEHIKIEKFPEVKKNWLKRFFFDRNKAPHIVEKYNPDFVVSLQNIIIPNIKCKQILYMHQSLPFVNYRFKLRDGKLWVYQNIIGRMIKKSCKRASKIIVQTKWIRQAIMDQCNVDAERIVVESPKIEHFIPYQPSQDDGSFFYPANGAKFKNHEVIVKALNILKQKNVVKEVVFTLSGEENAHIRNLRTICEKNKLNVRFVGVLSYQEVLVKYSKSTLLFPSYIETFGLPLLEARETGCKIIASDTLFAREICEDYVNARFFQFDNPHELSILMEENNDFIALSE